jgi:hypothetical protein
MSGRKGIEFDLRGWQFVGEKGNVLCWADAQGDGLELYQIDIPPDFPASLENPTRLHALWPDINNGVVTREVIQVDGVLAVRSILKIRQMGTGLTYIGAWQIPRRDFSFMLRIVCEEYPVTGLRESAVMVIAMNARQVTIRGDKIRGWTLKSSKRFSQPWMYKNISEDEKFDSDFPFHPLSRVRRHMRSLESSIRVADFVKQAAPYLGPQVKKRWWHQLGLR